MIKKNSGNGNGHDDSTINTDSEITGIKLIMELLLLLPLLLLGRIVVLRTLITDGVAWSVGLSVCLS